MSSIYVSNSAELNAALKSAQAGDNVLLREGVYSDISVKAKDMAVDVNVTSANADRPATLTDLFVSKSSGFNFSNIIVDVAPTSANANGAVYVSSSRDIHFDDMSFHGTMNDDPRDDMDGLGIKSSSDVSVTNSEFQQLRIGVGAADSNGVKISGNYIHDIRMDGIRSAGTSNISITDNYITDFTKAVGDHSDGIQFFTGNIIKQVENIVVSGNVITRGEGDVIQGIFMRNEEAAGSFKNVIIQDNLVVGANYNGIAVGQAAGVKVAGNVVVANSGTTSWISVGESTSVSVVGNSAMKFNLDLEGVVSSDNVQNITTSDDGAMVLHGWVDAHGALNGMAYTSSSMMAARGAAGPVVAESVLSDHSVALSSLAKSLTLVGAANLDGAGNKLDNHLVGNSGDNRLLGYEGDDILEGGDGDDTLEGGAGIDTASYEHAAAAVTVGLIRWNGDAVDGASQKTLGAGKDVLNSIENLTGSRFGDTLTGGVGSNVLSGGDGNDRLVGGLGADRLIGGGGADSFAFVAVEESTVGLTGRDVILDFSRADGDLIDLKKMDAITGGGDDKFKFVDAFTKSAGQLTVGVEGDHYIVQGDVNGDGVADFAISVYALSKLTAADFVF